MKKNLVLLLFITVAAAGWVLAAYSYLKLEGHEFYEIERDGNGHNQTVVKDEEFMPTASRVGVLVQGGKPGVFRLRTEKINTGSRETITAA